MRGEELAMSEFFRRFPSGYPHFPRKDHDLLSIETHGDDDPDL